jgi:dethiobiotin synthetase
MDAISATVTNAKHAKQDFFYQLIKMDKMHVILVAQLKLVALNVTAQLLASSAIPNMDFIWIKIQIPALAIHNKDTNSFLIMINASAKMDNLI